MRIYRYGMLIGAIGSMLLLSACHPEHRRSDPPGGYYYPRSHNVYNYRYMPDRRYNDNRRGPAVRDGRSYDRRTPNNSNDRRYDGRTSYSGNDRRYDGRTSYSGNDRRYDNSGRQTPDNNRSRNWR